MYVHIVHGERRRSCSLNVLEDTNWVCRHAIWCSQCNALASARGGSRVGSKYSRMLRWCVLRIADAMPLHSRTVVTRPIAGLDGPIGGHWNDAVRTLL